MTDPSLLFSDPTIVDLFFIWFLFVARLNRGVCVYIG
jgi:phage shock protein PspC (stress-responsive transcriptional regulator)